MANHTCMNLQIAEAQSLFYKEHYIVSSGSMTCLCLYIFRSIGTEGRRSQLQFDCVEYKDFYPIVNYFSD